MSLRDTLVELLSHDAPAAQATQPTTIEEGAILWSPPHRHHQIFHVREDADLVLECKVRNGQSPTPVPPMSPETAAGIARFLASITPEEIAQATRDRPLRRIDARRLAPFDAFALAHPSLNSRSATGELQRFLSPRTYPAFPCFTCEVANDMDVAWASFHYQHWNQTRFDRAAQPAVRLSRFMRRKAGKPKPREPFNLVAGNPITRALQAVEQFDIENWRGRVLRFANGNVALLPNGFTRPLSGRNDAIAIEEAFLTRDEIPETALPPHPIPQAAHLGIGLQFEATSRDAVDGIEPVEITEHATGRTVLKLWLTVQGDTMTGDYEIVDARLDAELVVAIFSIVYLRAFTRDHWRKSVATIVLKPKSDPSAARAFSYPPPK